MQKKLNISATIITFNEEKNIERCLKSLDFVDEIIVVDSYSNDNTVKICSKFTDKIYQKEFKGYGEQRNYAQSLAKHSFVFSIDADEEVSPKLKQYLIDNFDKLKNKYCAFAIPRRTFYLGKFIKNSGWYPDYKVRIYDKNVCKWDEKLVHESLKCEGKVFYIPKNFDLYHYSYQSVSEHLEKMNRYTTLFATENFEKFRKNKKKLIAFIFIKPFLKFIKMYFVKKGIFEGWRGFVIAILGSFYEFLKYVKIVETLKNLKKVEVKIYE